MEKERPLCKSKGKKTRGKQNSDEKEAKVDEIYKAVMQKVQEAMKNMNDGRSSVKLPNKAINDINETITTHMKLDVKSIEVETQKEKQIDGSESSDNTKDIDLKQETLDTEKKTESSQKKEQNQTLETVKIKNTETEYTNKTNEGNCIKPKRGPGRPRKNPVITTMVSNQSETESIAGQKKNVTFSESTKFVENKGKQHKLQKSKNKSSALKKNPVEDSDNTSVDSDENLSQENKETITKNSFNLLEEQENEPPNVFPSYKGSTELERRLSNEKDSTDNLREKNELNKSIIKGSKEQNSSPVYDWYAQKTAQEKFQKTQIELQNLGYDFLNENRLVKFENGKITKNPFKYNPKNEAHYQEVAEKVTKYVQGIMETDYDMRKFYLFNGTYVYATPDFRHNPEMTVIIHGSGNVQSGVWARKLCCSQGLQYGSQLPYIKHFTGKGQSVVCLNTNEPHHKTTKKPDPYGHAKSAFAEVIMCAGASRINIIAFSAGGSVLVQLIEDGIDFFRNNVYQVTLLDSIHGQNPEKYSEGTKIFLKDRGVHYIQSKQDLGKELTTHDLMKTLSANTTDHDDVPNSAFYLVTRDLDHTINNLKSKEASNKQSQMENMSVMAKLSLKALETYKAEERAKASSKFIDTSFGSPTHMSTLDINKVESQCSKNEDEIMTKPIKLGLNKTMNQGQFNRSFISNLAELIADKDFDQFNDMQLGQFMNDVLSVCEKNGKIEIKSSEEFVKYTSQQKLNFMKVIDILKNKSSLDELQFEQFEKEIEINAEQIIYSLIKPNEEKIEEEENKHTNSSKGSVNPEIAKSISDAAITINNIQSSKKKEENQALLLTLPNTETKRKEMELNDDHIVSSLINTDKEEIEEDNNTLTNARKKSVTPAIIKSISDTAIPKRNIPGSKKKDGNQASMVLTLPNTERKKNEALTFSFGNFSTNTENINSKQDTANMRETQERDIESKKEEIQSDLKKACSDDVHFTKTNCVSSDETEDEAFHKINTETILDKAQRALRQQELPKSILKGIKRATLDTNLKNLFQQEESELVSEHGNKMAEFSKFAVDMDENERDPTFVLSKSQHDSASSSDGESTCANISSSTTGKNIIKLKSSEMIGDVSIFRNKNIPNDPFRKKILNNLPIPNHVTKKFSRTTKYRKLYETCGDDIKKKKDALEHLRQSIKPHFYASKRLSTENAITLAKRCKTPYNIQTLFIEPSHKGVYICKGTCPDRSFCSTLDSFYWKNLSAKIKFTRSTNQILIKNTHQGKTTRSDFDHKRDWIKDWFYVPKLGRFVIHYSGNASGSRRIDGTMGFKPSDSEQSDDLLEDDNLEHEINPEGELNSEEVGNNEDAMNIPNRKISPTISSISNNNANGPDSVDPSVKRKKLEKISHLVKALPWRVLGMNEIMTAEVARMEIDNSKKGNNLLEASEVCIVDPEGGEVYTIDYSNLKERTGVKNWQEHVLVDSFSWKGRYGEARKHHSAQRLKVLPYDVRLGESASKQFKRIVYVDENAMHVLIHYLGDNKTGDRKPHGNCILNDTPHYRRSAIVKKNIEKIGTHVKPSEALRTSLNSTGPGLVREVASARNIDSIKYIQKQQKENDKIASDELVAARYIAQSMTDFVREIICFPNILIAAASDQALINLTECISNMDEDTPLVFHYDTKYGYGDYFLSVLSYRYHLMERTWAPRSTINREPIAILAILLHDHRPLIDHKRFMDLMQDIMTKTTLQKKKKFKDVKKFLVTDREFDRIDWDNTKLTYCQLHIRQNIERQARKLGYKNEEIIKLNQEVLRLINSSSLEKYTKRLSEFFKKQDESSIWRNEKFQKYYLANIHPDLLESSGNWKLAEEGMPYTARGITNNVAESVNSVLGRQKGVDKLSLPKAMLNLRFLVDHWDSDISEAYFSVGPYRLKEQYKHLQKPKGDLPARNILSADERHKKIHQYVHSPKNSDEDESPIKKPTIDFFNQTIQEEAKWLQQNGRVTLVSELRTFLVKTENDKTHKVDLAERTCTCGAKKVCAHMIACQVATGNAKYFSAANQKRINVTPNKRKDRLGTKAHYKYETTHLGIESAPVVISDENNPSLDDLSPTSVIESYKNLLLTPSDKKRNKTPTPRASNRKSRYTPETRKTSKDSLVKVSSLNATPTQSILRNKAQNNELCNKTVRRKILSTPSKSDTNSDNKTSLDIAVTQLNKFGYDFHERNYLRTWKNGMIQNEEFKFTTEEQKIKLYEFITAYIHAFMETEYKMIKVNLNNTFFYATPDYLTNKNQLLLLIGDEKESPGIWSVKKIIEDSVETGTMFNNIESALSNDTAVICFNNTSKSLVLYKNVLLNTRAEKMAVMAYSTGTTTAVEFLKYYLSDVNKRVNAMALVEPIIFQRRFSELAKKYLLEQVVCFRKSSVPINNFVLNDGLFKVRSAGLSQEEESPFATFEYIKTFFNVHNFDLISNTEYENEETKEQKTSRKEEKLEEILIARSESSDDGLEFIEYLAPFDDFHETSHTVENFDIKSYRPEMNLKEGKYKQFTDANGGIIAIFSPRAGHAQVFWANHQVANKIETAQFAACIVSQSARCNGNNQNEALVSFEKSNIDDLISECASQQYLYEDEQKKEKDQRKDMTCGLKFEKFPLICYERLPTAENEGLSSLVQCAFCNEKYHKKCVSPYKPNFIDDTTILCNICSLPYSGLQWGAGEIINTCPLDNVFSAVVLHDINNPNFIESLPAATSSHITFKKAAEEAKNGEDGEAQMTWSHACNKHISKNAWGNPTKLVYKHIVNDQFTYTTFCSEKCEKHCTQITQMYQLKMGENPIEVFNKFEKGNFVKGNCRKCKQKIRTTKMSIVVSKNPSIFSVDFQACQSSSRELAENLPSILTFSGVSYQLSLITISQDSRQHFVGLVKDEKGKWMTYDGLLQKKKHKFRLPYTSDWDPCYSKVNSVDYYRIA
jgi:hypothetical protein